MSKRRPPKLSKPGEHGGLVILVGSGVLGAAVSPRPLHGVIAALVLVSAYMARGPVERRARRFRPRIWDARATWSYAILALSGIVFIGARAPLVAVAVAIAAIGLPSVGVVVTRARLQRSSVVELIALGMCGAAAGLVALAGGSTLATASHIGVPMLVYGAATVGVVRSETRREKEPYWASIALAMLMLGALAVGLSGGWIAMALGPRSAHALVRWISPPEPLPIGLVAARETIELAGFVGLVLLFG